MLIREWNVELDPEDEIRVRQHAWQPCVKRKNTKKQKVYFQASIKGRRVYLHHFILKITRLPANFETDHIDKRTLNCKKSNLRLVPHGRNVQNAELIRTNSSGIRGVRWVEWSSKTKKRPRKKWSSIICVNYQKKFLGYYNTKEEAAAAYNKAAEIYYPQGATAQVIT